MPRLGATGTQPGTQRRDQVRATLSRDRILGAAVALADRDGIAALSMRNLARDLGVDPMSLYNHVRDKDALLEGAVDLVIADIEPVLDGPDWRASLRATVYAARSTLKRHPWAKGVIQTRTSGTPAFLRYMEAVLTIFHDGGVPIGVAHHAVHILGSRLLGFSQDLFDDPDRRPDPDVSALQARQLALAYPRVGELAMAVSHDGGLGGCDDDTEFGVALELTLDGLERLLSTG
jgi:AcrR family transcriptional regulator